MQNAIDLYKQLEEMGDAVVDYINGAGKLRYAVVTVDFSTPYVLNKVQAKQDEDLIDDSDRLLVFSWDADKTIRLSAKQVKKMVPLSSILQNK